MCYSSRVLGLGLATRIRAAVPLEMLASMARGHRVDDSLGSAVSQPLTSEPPWDPLRNDHDRRCFHSQISCVPSGGAGPGPAEHLESTCPRIPSVRDTRARTSRYSCCPEDTGLHGLPQEAGTGSLVPAGGKLSQHSVNPAVLAHRILLPHDDSPSFLFSLHLLERPVPTACSLRHPEGSPITTWAAFGVEGMKMEAQTRGKPARHPRAHPPKHKGCQRPPKIRNYNSKD